jgi:hypothetical protein
MKYAPFILLFCLSSAFGQSISKSSISPLGGTHINSQDNLTLSYNVGEVSIGTMTAGGIQLGSGYYNSFDLEALSTEELYAFGKIEIYPNPTTNILYIKSDKLNEKHTVQLRNLDGKEVFDTKFENTSEINFSLLPSGIYFLTITNNELKSITQKIIKQ